MRSVEKASMTASAWASIASRTCAREMCGIASAKSAGAANVTS
jgi:hypothetical protein